MTPEAAFFAEAIALPAPCGCAACEQEFFDSIEAARHGETFELHQQQYRIGHALAAKHWGGRRRAASTALFTIEHDDEDPVERSRELHHAPPSPRRLLDIVASPIAPIAPPTPLTT